MSVVASVAINVDSRDAAQKLRQFQSQSTAASRAAEQLQSSTQKVGREMQTAANGMRYFIDAAGRARKENGQFVTTAEAAAAGLEKQARSAKNAANAFKGLGSVIASIGAGALVANMLRGAASAEQLQLRLKLLSREYGETDRVQKFVSESAATFGQSQIEAATGVADVYARLRPLGKSLDEIQTVYKGFNAVALASGTSAEAASSAFLQLSQALGSGTLQGDEFRSIAEQVPGILRLVSEELGVSVGELKQLGSDGKITADVLINALAKGFDQNKDKIQELLALSPAQRFKEFKNSTQQLSNALGSELLPAVTPVVKAVTELLKLFGQLPGPLKTIIAAVLGLTAAFVALAPAIKTAIGLLSSLSLATLAAAGPWVALAAGITAAAVALGSYQTASQRTSKAVGVAARGGGAADLAKGRNRIVELQQEISLIERQQAGRAGTAGSGSRGRGGQRGAGGTSLSSLKAELARLQGDVAAGEQVASVAGVTSGGGATTTAGADASGAGNVSNEAEKLAKELERSLAAGKALATQFSRQVLLLKAADDTEKERLQIQFDFEDRAKQIAELKNAEQQAALTLENNEIRRLQLIDLQTEALKRQAEEADKLFKEAIEGTEFGVAGEGTVASGLADKISQLKDDLNPIKLQVDTIVNGATAIGDAFSTAFGEVITGAKSTQEALADAFKKIGDAFISMAVEIIAKQMTLIILQTIFNALSGAGGTLGTANKNLTGTGALKTPIPGLKVGGYANGGFVTGPTLAMVGEGSEPEYVIPASKMSAAMSRYSAGARGSAVIPGNGTSASGGGMGGATGSTIDVRYTVERINSVDYVTADQFQRGMQQAAQQGAAEGQRQTLRRLQNSPSTRRRVGV